MLQNRDRLEAWDRDHFMHPSTDLAMHARGDGAATVVTGDKYSGSASLRITPLQRHSMRIPGWAFRIRENPDPGEYRYMRLAWKAPKAAGVIHGDFERGFIKAETVAFDDLIECGSIATARDRGLYRMEGKEYIVQEGDVMLFKFNV